MSSPDENSEPRFRPRLPVVPMLLILVILGFALFGEKGILRAWQANRHKAALEAELRQQEETIAQLKNEVKALQSDRRYIEGIARRELGMVKEDELVYQYPKKSDRSDRSAP
jgi:cell division protein FtsB